MTPFTRDADAVVAQLAQAEAGVLGLLVDQLEQLLAADAEEMAGDPVLGRLFPAGHASDAELAGDYRDLTESALREGKAGDLALVRATLPAAGGAVRLDEDQARAWLRTSNDLRLALGTRLGVTADTEPPEDADDEAGSELTVYYWLTAVQGSLVDALVSPGGRRR